MLTFGAKGINYYTLVSAPYLGGLANGDYSPFYNTHSILNTKGEPTDYYKYAADINAHIKAMDHVLINSTLVGMIFQGDEPYDKDYSDIAGDNHIPRITKSGYLGGLNFGGKKFSEVKLNSVSGNHVMIGAFNYNGNQTAFLVVNNHLTEADNITLSLTGSYSCEVIANAATSWQIGSSVSLSLEAGRSALVVLHEGEVSMNATVIFDQNYDSSRPAPQSVVVSLNNAIYPELPVPTRGGYTFGGWYTDAECTGEPVKAGDPLAVTGGHILYAKWVGTAIENPFLVPSASGAYNGPSGYYATVTPDMSGDEVAYMATINSKGDPTNSTDRRIVLNVTTDKYQVVSMKVLFTACTGTPALEVKRDDGYAIGYTVTDAEGNIPDSKNLELNKWYTLTWISDGYDSYRILPMEGSAANGTLYMKDITVKSVEGPIAPSYYNFVAPIETNNGPLYMGYAIVTGDSTNIGYRYTTLTVDNSSLDTISFKMMMAATSGTPDLQIKNAGGTAMAFTVSDAEGNIVAATDMQLGQWYTVSWTADGSASYQICSFAGTAVNGTYYVKDITVTPAPEDAPTLVAQTASYLTEATAEQLTEAGITDATGTVYRFTKAAGLEGGVGKAGALWLENRKGDAYVTFDFYYGAFSNVSLPSVGYAHSGPYLLLYDGTSFYKPNENGVTIVEKGTDTSAETYVHNGTSTVYIKLAQQTWYTVTMPVTSISKLYLPVNTTDSATMFITNIAWSN